MSIAYPAAYLAYNRATCEPLVNHPPHPPHSLIAPISPKPGRSALHVHPHHGRQLVDVLLQPLNLHERLPEVLLRAILTRAANDEDGHVRRPIGLLNVRLDLVRQFGVLHNIVRSIGQGLHRFRDAVQSRGGPYRAEVSSDVVPSPLAHLVVVIEEIPDRVARVAETDLGLLLGQDGPDLEDLVGLHHDRLGGLRCRRQSDQEGEAEDVAALEDGRRRGDGGGDGVPFAVAVAVGECGVQTDEPSAALADCSPESRAGRRSRREAADGVAAQQGRRRHRGKGEDRGRSHRFRTLSNARPTRPYVRRSRWAFGRRRKIVGVLRSSLSCGKYANHRGMPRRAASIVGSTAVRKM
mmetsp:Transcript_8293/g.24943  ORF Transcript_8293/g.24943 Transcript_8293/m.24943 type:complete len:352 (+) Transcript_8293:200-1255(+)